MDESEGPVVDIVPDNNSTTEEEIIEDISIAGEFTDSDDEIPLFLSDYQKYDDRQHQKDREEEDEELLKSIDDALSASNIAKHFKPEKEMTLSDEKENLFSCRNKSNSDTQKSSNEYDKEFGGVDTILINDRKINLSDLTKCGKDDKFNVKNKLKLFSSLDLTEDLKPSPPRKTHSLDLDLSLESINSSSNEDQQENQIDEIEEPKQFISRIDDQLTVKKMDRVDYLKDPLDDITEEESDMEQKENQTSTYSGIRQKFAEDEFTQLYESGTTSLRNYQFLSLESQLSKDRKAGDSSKEIDSEKSQFLEALNLKLSSLVKRSQESTLKSDSKDFMSFATTTSTEYRTIDEELNMKIFDIDNELQKKSTCIEKLKENLEQSMIERDQILSENQTLSEEILKLQTRVAEFGMHSRKSSDDNKMTVIASNNNNIDVLSKSFSNDELACFEKIRQKIEIYHENEIEKVRDQNLKELKIIMDGSREVFEQNFEGNENAVS